MRGSRNADEYPLKLLLDRCDDRLAVTSDYAVRVRQAREDKVWQVSYDFATTALGFDVHDAMLLADWAVFISSTEDP